MHKIIAESLLELQIGFAGLQLLRYHLERNFRIKISKYLLKLIV